jgi:hypothetical protein
LKAYRPELNLGLTQQIVASIRAGGYAHVSAQAWGVSPRRFERWLKLGRRKNAPDLYAGFAAEVDAAVAQARLRAEVAVLAGDAKAWLEHGPGKDTRGNPGWTRPVKGPDTPAEQEQNALLNQVFMGKCNKLFDALSPFPEARSHVIDFMEKEAAFFKKPDDLGVPKGEAS